MALLKHINSGFGFDATYWKIAESNTNFIAGTVDVTLYGYVTQETRTSGCEPLIKTGVSLPISNELDRKFLYNLIKTTKDFEDSIDA